MPGEQFLETEIVYLAKAFDRVYIVPLGGDISQPVRTVPANCHVIEDIQISIKSIKRAPISLFKGLYYGRHGLLQDIVYGNKVYRFGFRAVINNFKTTIISGIVAKELTKIINEVRPALIYSYWLSTGAIAAIFSKHYSEKSIPIISRVHNFDLYAERHNPPICPYQPFLVNSIDKVVAISNDGHDYLLKKYPKSSKTITKSRLGVLGGKKAVPSSDNVLRIVSCSFLVPVKRVELIAKALMKIDIPIHWVHIGDGPERVNIEALISQINNPKIKVLLLGQLPNEEVLHYYETHPVDLFINVSSFEGIPVSIMEAMSRGIPVAATPVGGIPEIVNQDNGFLFSINPSASEIREVLKNFYGLKKEKQLQKRSSAFATWENMYNAETNYLSFINELYLLIK